jgi:hypothetical protein
MGLLNRAAIYSLRVSLKALHNTHEGLLTPSIRISDPTVLVLIVFCA